jgi:hypothetical protein
MQKRSLEWILLLLLSLLAQPAAAWAQARGVANVIDLQGQVSVERAGGAKWVPATAGMVLYTNDHLKTAASSAAALEFAVGGKVGVTQSSEIVLLGGRNVAKQSDRAVFSLTAGSVWARIAPQPAGQPFQIKTQSCTIGVKGTEFVVEPESDGGNGVSVLEGKVAVSDHAGGNVHLVEPGQQLHWLHRGTPRLERFRDAQELRQRLQTRHAVFHRFVRERLQRHKQWMEWGHPGHGFEHHPPLPNAHHRPPPGIVKWREKQLEHKQRWQEWHAQHNTHPAFHQPMRPRTRPPSHHAGQPAHPLLHHPTPGNEQNK